MKKNYKYNYNAQVFCKYQLIEPFLGRTSFIIHHFLTVTKFV